MPATMKHVVSVPWTDEERTLLRQLWENGLGPVLIGRMLGRSKYSVTKQTQALQLPKMRQQPGRRHHRNHGSPAHSHCAPAPARCRRCRAS